MNKIQQIYEQTVLAEYTKEKFAKEIGKAKGNKNRLNNLKKTIQGMGNMGLSKDDINSLVSRINSML